MQTTKIDQPNFNKLDNQTQDFIEQKAKEYRLSFQDIKALIDMAIDLNMWQESTLMELWEDKPNRKLTIKAIKQRYNTIQTKPKNYQNFTASKGNRKFKLIEIEKEKVGFGQCPVASPKTRCCNLLTLDAVESCGFDCSYCSIQSFYNQNQIGFDTNFKSRLQELKLDPTKTYHIGTGQSSDSLLWGNRGGILEALFDFARKYPNVILELKSKSDNIKYLLENDIPKNIICTWSLNPQTVIDNEEHLTASLEERIKSAKAVANKGNLVGFHFHPIIVYENYLDEYKEIAHRLLSEFEPNQVAMVSMGTLTFIKPVIKQLRERNFSTKILQMPLTNASGKLSYPLEIKEEMFKEVYNFFKPWHGRVYFYLCMEDASLWQSVFRFEYHSNDEMERDMIESYLKKIEAIR